MHGEPHATFPMIFPGSPIDEELQARIDTVLRWEATHEPVLQFAANDWTRADRTFTEVLEGMGPFLSTHHQMLEDMVADGTQRPLALEGWTWRAVSPCGCCLFGHVYHDGSKACSFAAGGFGDDRCSVGSVGWQDLLRQIEETPGCPDPCSRPRPSLRRPARMCSGWGSSKWRRRGCGAFTC